MLETVYSYGRAAARPRPRPVAREPFIKQKSNQLRNSVVVKNAVKSPGICSAYGKNGRGPRSPCEKEMI